MKRTAPHRTQAMHTAAASPVRDVERALLAAAAVAVGFAAVLLASAPAHLPAPPERLRVDDPRPRAVAAAVTSEAPNYSPTQYQPTTH